MFRFSLSLLIVVVSFRLSEQTLFGKKCPYGWEHFEESCYVFGTSLETWVSAQVICAAHRARLAEVDNADENKFLKNMAKSNSAEGTWTGGTDLLCEGHWVWPSERRSVDYFTNWGRGEPNNAGDQNCMLLYNFYDYKWDDQKCSKPYNYICEAKLKSECCF